jgi:DNA-binding MarR family transcriptional regulator
VVVRTAPLRDLIGYALRRAQGAVYADLNDSLSELDLRPVQYTLLLMVAENPGASQSGVCEALGIQKANCVPTMSELERRGLILRKKSTSDARSYELHITAKGKRILQRAGEAQASHERKLIERIGIDGRDQLLELLGKLTDLK